MAQQTDRKKHKKLVAPSILSADFARLGDEIEAVTKAGADWIHVDVMDGHFVPNLTIGAPVVASLKKVSKIPLDVHLMIESPEKLIEAFAKAGADYLTIHVEATKDVEGCLKRIRELGVKPGITLRPRTALSAIEPYLSLVDLVLVMTVEPGFGGQSFMQDQVAKVTDLARLREQQSNSREQKSYNYLIEVDGGVSDKTIGFLPDADVLVAGSFVFNSKNANGSQAYAEAIQKLKV